MADNPNKIIVDDDWKEQARREKEKLAEQVEERPGGGSMPPAEFVELINLIAMQAMAAMGMLSGPGGERMPPNLAAAKHFVDMIQVLDDKTKGNLTAEEQKLLDQVLYEIRMRFIQMSSAMGGGDPGPAV